MMRPRISLILFCLALLAACHHGTYHVCVENTVCDTGDPCTYGETVCGADDTAHCVVKRVETTVPQCSGRTPAPCVAGASCDTGDPCLDGETVCGADGVSHCIVTRIENVPGCSG